MRRAGHAPYDGLRACVLAGDGAAQTPKRVNCVGAGLPHGGTEGWGGRTTPPTMAATPPAGAEAELMGSGVVAGAVELPGGGGVGARAAAEVPGGGGGGGGGGPSGKKTCGKRAMWGKAAGLERGDSALHVLMRL
jgi:hypothetical protein